MLRSNIGETPKKQPFLRRGVKKDHIGFFDCGIYPLSPHGHSPYISSGTPHKATGHGRERMQSKKTNAFVVIRLSSFIIFVEYRRRFGIVKPKMQFSLASALTFHYICNKYEGKQRLFPTTRPFALRAASPIFCLAKHRGRG